MNTYTVNQVATLLGKAPVTVRKAARDHSIGRKPGRDHIFTAADIDALRGLIRDHRGQPRGPRKPKSP